MILSNDSASGMPWVADELPDRRLPASDFVFSSSEMVLESTLTNEGRVYVSE